MGTIIKDIDRIFKANHTTDGFTFLGFLDEYLNLINKDTFLSKVLLSLQEHHTLESVHLTKEISNAKSEMDSMIHDEIQEQIEVKYPVYSYRQLLRAKKQFQYIIQYETEEQIPDVQVVIPYDETNFTFTNQSKTSLKKIPVLVELTGLRQQFRQFHTAFIKIAEEAEQQGGVFSKYFSYDPASSTLYFEGKEIQINERKRLTNAHYLLSYLFKNDPFEKHFIDELISEEVLDNPSWKSYYDACIDIQNKVERTTETDNFLDFNSGNKMYLRINPEHSFGSNSD